MPKVCSQCGENKGKKKFSTGQWKKNDGERVCRLCRQHNGAVESGGASSSVTLNKAGLTFEADFDTIGLLAQAASKVPAHDHKSQVVYQLIRQAPTKTKGGFNVLQLVAKTIQASAAAKLPPAVSMMPGKQLIIQAYELYCDKKSDVKEGSAISAKEKKILISEWQNSSRVLSEAVIYVFQEWIAHEQSNKDDAHV